MQMTPLPPNPDLERKLVEAAAWMASAPYEQVEAMLRRQREGYVRAEMSWPKDCPYR